MRQKETRGGYRPGAGRKRETLSVTQVREMLAKAEAYAEKYGKTVNDILLEFVYGTVKGVTKKDQLAAIKLWMDKTHIPVTEGGEADEVLGPGIYLPEQQQDPMLKAVNE